MKTITLTNKGYIKFTENLINSIKKNNVELDLTIGAMDNFAFTHFKNLGFNVQLISEQNQKKFLKQNSSEFGEYMIHKLNMITYFLERHRRVLYVDGDIVIKKNINEYLNDEIGKLDLLIQNDINLEKPDNENLCAGFMVINSNEKTREFFNTDNIPREIIMNGLHDQGYINSEKEKLNYKKLPSELFPNGSYFYKNFKQINPKIIHFNYVIGRKKITTMKKYGEWYL